MMRILAIISLGSFLVSCSVTQSGANFSKGTELLVRGDFSEAIPYLENAARLSPDSSLYQTNLSHAYLLTGELDKAWHHARLALDSKSPKEKAFFGFLNVYETLDMKYRFNKSSMHEEELRTILGVPDSIEVDPSSKKEIWSYGLARFTFKDKMLASSECKLENHQSFQK